MNRRLCLYSFCFFFALINHAQSVTFEDSLRTVLKSAPDDTNRVKAIEQLILEIYLERPLEALELSKEMSELAETLEYTHGIAMAYSYVAYFLEIAGEAQLALEYYQKCLPFFRKVGSKIDEAIIYNNIANLYKIMGLTDLALEYNYRSLRLKLELGNIDLIANSLNNIGIIYVRQERTKKALQFFYKSLELYRQIGKNIGVANCLSHIGSVLMSQDHYPESLNSFKMAYHLFAREKDTYSMGSCMNSMGTIYQKMGDTPQALIYYEKGRQISISIGDKRGIASADIAMGHIFFLRGELDTALICYQQGLQNYRDIPFAEGIASATYRLGEYYFKMNDHGNAKKYLQESYDLSEDIGYPKFIRNAAKLLYSLLKDEGNYRQAVLVQERYIIMNDSIENVENRKLLLKQKHEYETSNIRRIQQQKNQEAEEELKEELVRRYKLQNTIVLILLLGLFGLVLNLGKVNISPVLARICIFASLLTLFEFLLVVTDPVVDRITGNEPVLKLLVNTCIAALIFPVHAVTERRLKKKVIGLQRI